MVCMRAGGEPPARLRCFTAMSDPLESRPEASIRDALAHPRLRSQLRRRRAEGRSAEGRSRISDLRMLLRIRQLLLQARRQLRILARSGNRTLLIDADLRNPSLSRMLGYADAPGLLDVVANQTPFDDLVITDSKHKFDFLPSATRIKPSNSSDILGTDKRKEH